MSQQPPEEPGSVPPGPAPQQSANPYQPYTGPGYGPTGVPHWAPDHPDATTALVLGIIGISVCQLVAPFALVRAKRVRNEIDASGGRYGGRQQAQIGYVLGIVGSALMALYLLGFLVYIVFVVILVAAGGS